MSYEKMYPTVLLILDGWGIAPPGPGNAVELARKPVFDKLWDKYPHTELSAHGKFVGLPSKQVGNSEAGHMNIGAGRIVEQDAVRISESIADGRFFKNLALLQTIDHALKNNSALHLLGMISDGDSPHSSLDHLYALVDMVWKRGARKIYLHLITDGRDSPQFAALRILDGIEGKVRGRAIIATIIGRFYAMDRGKNWLRIKKAYDCLVGEGKTIFKNYREAVLHAYNSGISDEYIEPSVICATKKEEHCSRLRDKDAVIFFNLRSDRARQLTKCFVQKDFNRQNPKAFRRNQVVENLEFCAFTDFGPDLDHILTAFPSPDIKYTLPTVLKKYRQLYVAETEKYAHVTYFLNGGYADPVNGEKRLRVPSLKIKSYAEKPEMSVYKITNQVLRALQDKVDFVCVNFANPDMVGHTGEIPAVIKAIEHVDICLKKVFDEVRARHGHLLVTADHGNAEKMLDQQTGEIWTGHTTNPVPFILASDEYRGAKLRSGVLGNIASTIYDIIGTNRLPKAIINSLIK